MNAARQLKFDYLTACNHVVTPLNPQQHLMLFIGLPEP